MPRAKKQKTKTVAKGKDNGNDHGGANNGGGKVSMSTTQRAKSTKTRSNTNVAGTRVSRTTTHRRVEKLSDGSTRIIEDQSVSFVEKQLKEQISVELQEEFSVELRQEMNCFLDKSPLEILQNNKYLSWRLQYVLDSCKQFQKNNWNMSTNASVVRPPGVKGDGFLASYTWQKCMQYADDHYNECVEDGESIPDKTTFISEYMSNRLIDRLLVSISLGMMDKVEWPVCISDIGEISMIPWVLGPTVKVVHDMKFAFGVRSVNLEACMRGYMFKPHFEYFPFDIIRMLPCSKQILCKEMENHRQQRLQNLDAEPEFQRQLSQRVSEEQK